MKHFLKTPIAKILVVFVVCIAFFAIFANIYYYIRFPEGCAEITGTVVDNDYNNLLSGGNLVRISDKIYYNYMRNDHSYGLVQISENGSNRIFWEGQKSGAYRLQHNIRQHNGQLIMAFNDKIQHFSSDVGKFEPYEPLNVVPNITIFYQTVGQKIIYHQTTDPQDIEVVLNGNLKLYEAAKESSIAGPNVNSFYAVGDEIYYFNAESYTGGEFRKYNLVNGTDVSVYKLDDYSNVFDFIIEQNYLVFCAVDQTATNAVYKVDLNSTERKLETVCVTDSNINSYNVYNGIIYVASDSGLTTYDVITNKSRQLYDKAAEECYIVDDMWVYFVDAKAKLWRIMQDGSITEKVFG